MMATFTRSSTALSGDGVQAAVGLGGQGVNPNMPFEPRHRTLVEILNHSVEQFGPRPLFGTRKAGRWTWTTYAAFASMVDRFRCGLASLGVRRGDTVAIISNNRVEWAVAAYASYRLSAAIVPMYEAQRESEWEFILGDCGARVLLVANGDIFAKAKRFLESVPTLEHIVLIDGTANGDGRVRTYESLLDAGGPFLRTDPDPQDIAGVIYTSGTTGQPKGVMLTHLNLASNLDAMRRIVPDEDDDRSLSFLPWAHVFGQTVELHGLLSTGASMAIANGVDRLIDDLAEVRPTLLFTVPRVFNKVYTVVNARLAAKPAIVKLAVAVALRVKAKERTGGRLTLGEHVLLRLVDRAVFADVRARLGGRLRYAICGGAALSRQVAEFVDALGIRVYEGYGLTETSPVATSNVPGARKFGSVGRAIPGVRVEIDSATAEEKPAEGDKPARREGEIVVYGHNVMNGYFKRPSENAAAFTADGGFRTGDVGYIDCDGYLYITGRIKEQYKLENGKYVVPSPLEEQLKLSPYVANAMIYGENRPYNVAIIVADVAAARAWAEKHGVRLQGGDEALFKDYRVRKLFQGEIDKYGAALRRFEAVRHFALIATDFTAENGLATPSMKLKRPAVLRAYKHVIEELYAKPLGGVRPD
jgi:long-chain acyl-CoA synthetase